MQPENHAAVPITHGCDPEHHRVVADIEVDFVFEANGAKFAVEIDGETHDHTHRIDMATRKAALVARNCRVEKFSAHDVFETDRRGRSIQKVDKGD